MLSARGCDNSAHHVRLAYGTSNGYAQSQYPAQQTPKEATMMQRIQFYGHPASGTCAPCASRIANTHATRPRVGPRGEQSFLLYVWHIRFTHRRVKYIGEHLKNWQT